MLNSISSRLGLPTHSYRVVISYYLSYIALGTFTPALGPALPFLAERTGVSLDVASSLFSAKALGFMLGSFVTGRVLERFPSHGVLQAALLIMALSMLSLAVAPAFIFLLITLFVGGFFTAWLDVGSNILIVWELKKRVAPFLTGLHFIWGLGALCTPLIITQLLLRTGSLLAPFAVIAAIVSASALLYIRLPSPSPTTAAKEQSGPIPLKSLIPLMGMLFLAGTMENAIGGFIFSYVLRTGLGSEQVAGGITSTYFVAITCTRLTVAILLTKFSSQRVLAVALTLIAVTVISVLVLPPTLTIVWIAVLLCGIGEASLFPLTLSVAPQYVPLSGKLTSLIFVGASMGFLTMPLLIGRLFESAAVGPQIVWYYTLVGAFLYALCLFILRFSPRVIEFAVPAPQAAGTN